MKLSLLLRVFANSVLSVAVVILLVLGVRSLTFQDSTYAELQMEERCATETDPFSICFGAPASLSQCAEAHAFNDLRPFARLVYPRAIPAPQIAGVLFLFLAVLLLIGIQRRFLSLVSALYFIYLSLQSCNWPIAWWYPLLAVILVLLGVFSGYTYQWTRISVQKEEESVSETI